MGKTSIEVDDSTWKDLNRRKDRGDTFDDVISELLAEDENGTTAHEPPMADGGDAND